MTRFADIQPGDQLEMPARKVPWLNHERDTRDPERPARIAGLPMRRLSRRRKWFH